MSRVYTSAIDVGNNNVNGIFELHAPTDACVEIISWSMGFRLAQFNQDEGFLFVMYRGVGAITPGSGGTTDTPPPIEYGDSAFGGTVQVNTVSPLASAGSGALEEIENVALMSRHMPYFHIYEPDERPIVSPGNYWIMNQEINLINYLAGGLQHMRATLWFREIGG